MCACVLCVCVCVCVCVLMVCTWTSSFFEEGLTDLCVYVCVCRVGFGKIDLYVIMLDMRLD